MKNLYISDLDGTLLNNSAEVSRESVELLNKAIKNGVFFSVATARTAATVLQMLDKIEVNAPIVLMNGVTVYDMKKGEYVRVCAFSDKAKREFAEVVKSHSSSGFFYCYEGNETTTYYQNTFSPNAEQFIREREEKYGKKFTKINSLDELAVKAMVYYSYNDYREKLQPVYEKVSKIEGLRCEFYADNYNTDFWYLEVCSQDASKKNAVEFLKQKYGFDRVVAFGDNFNDIPLFEASDECYAVENAKAEVKRLATAVIGKNSENAVAEFICNDGKRYVF